jgi:hypothetical protein
MISTAEDVKAAVAATVAAVAVERRAGSTLRCLFLPTR